MSISSATNVYFFKIRSSRSQRKKTLRITANNDEHAWGKALALYPAKYLQLKLKYIMDLITAKVEAAALSIKKGKRTYINLNEEDEECEVSLSPDSKKENILAVFAAGNEIKDVEEVLMVLQKDSIEPAHPSTKPKSEKLKVQKNNTKPKQEKPVKTVKQDKIMSTKTKKTKVKEAKKSASVKKIAKEPKGDKIARGNNMFLTPTEWKKVDSLLNKEGLTFSAWSRSLVQAKIK